MVRAMNHLGGSMDRCSLSCQHPAESWTLHSPRSHPVSRLLRNAVMRRELFPKVPSHSYEGSPPSAQSSARPLPANPCTIPASLLPTEMPSWECVRCFVPNLPRPHFSSSIPTRPIQPIQPPFPLRQVPIQVPTAPGGSMQQILSHHCSPRNAYVPGKSCEGDE